MTASDPLATQRKLILALLLLLAVASWALLAWPSPSLDMARMPGMGPTMGLAARRP